MNLYGVLEGILFVVGNDGISFEKLKSLLEINDSELKDLLSELTNEYESDKRGFRLENFGNKYKLVTKKEHKKYYENCKKAIELKNAK